MVNGRLFRLRETDSDRNGRYAWLEGTPEHSVHLHNSSVVDFLQVHVDHTVGSSDRVDALPLLDPGTKRRKIRARYVDTLD